MSRSRRKIAIHGNLKAESDKVDKQLGNRRYRQHVSNELNELKGLQVNDELLNDLEETIDFEEYETIVSDWSFDKDGKHYGTLSKIVIDDEEFERFVHAHPNKQFIKRSVYESIMRK